MSNDRLPAPTQNRKVFAKHPAGSHQLVLADVIHLGFRVTEWQGKKKQQERVALIWQSGKIDTDSPDARRFTLQTEFTYSTFKSANLRGFLGGWLGVPLVDETAAINALVDLPSRIGTNGIASIVHETKGDKTYVNVASMAPLMDGMQPLAVVGYTRNEWWEKKKAEYARQVADFGGAGPERILTPDDEFPEELSPGSDNDDPDLPF